VRLLRITPVLLAVLIALALVAAWQVPRFLDWDHYRATVESVASAGLGRPVQIAGPIRLSLLPQATLRARDVTIADIGDGATVGELRMRVGLSALLTGRVEPQDLVLQDANISLPWPLAGFTLRGTPPPAGLHARMENGTLRIGGLAITGISGEVSAGGPTTALSAAGLATVMGRPWRMTGRMGRAGADGSATIEISLDGQGAGIGTGGALTGQVAADGNLSGRITGRGPDLSLLLPAPAQPWNADGRLIAGSGLLVADDLEVTIGGSPARGAVALRLLPQLRLDAALATNRLDLDAWLPPLLQGGTVALPTGIDLSAEAAPFAGGILRRLRAGFDLTGDGMRLRDSEAVLPGDAALQLSGVLASGHFAGDARLAAPDLAQTLAWLKPRAPALLDALPFATLHTATLSASVQADSSSVAFGGLRGDVGGVPVTGDLALRGGPRPAVAANLQLTGPVLDHWLPDAPPDLAHAAGWLAALPHRFAAFDADITLTAQHPVWHGTVFDQLALDGDDRAGTLDLRHAALTGPALSVTLSGGMDGGGRISNGTVTVQLGQAERLADSLPPGWQFTQPLFRGPASLDASVSGLPAALTTVARAEMADARLQLNGRWDVPGGRWSGMAAFHHPGAPRLLSALGLTDAGQWLGDGSLSLQASVTAGSDQVALAGLELSAGALRSTGDLTLANPATGPPALTGTLAVDTLPLPLPYVRSANPLPFQVLRSANATLAIRAAHLLWGGAPQGDAASAHVSLLNGVLRLDDVAAHLAGGALAGRLTLDATAAPRLSASATLTNAVLDGPAFDAGLDVLAGAASGSMDVSATGYSPAALLASLQGSARASVRNGTITGLDAGRLLSVLSGVASPASKSAVDPAVLQAGVAETLRRGTTPFGQLDATGTLANGVLTLTGATVTAPAATITASGSLDLPGDALDLSLSLQPELAGAPAIGLRLIGPAANPSRTPGFAALTGWLAAP
jgi:hypothetical protein